MEKYIKLLGAAFSLLCALLARGEAVQAALLQQEDSCEIAAVWDVYSQEGEITVSLALDSIFYEVWHADQMTQRIRGHGESITFVHLLKQGSYKIYATDPRTNYEHTWLVGEVNLAEPVPEDVQPTTGTNWIKTKTYTYQDNNQPYVMDVSYFNGLGYLNQTVNVKANASGTGDIITPVVYDCHYHEDTKTYLPYATQDSAGNGKQDLNAFYNQRQYYTQKYGPEDGNYAYSTKVYDSPTDYYSAQIKPGSVFHAGAGKIAGFSKEGNTKEDKVYIIDFTRADNGYEVKKPYPANTLFKDIQITEDNKKKVTFTDQLGHIVLERIEIKGDLKNEDTYYVYDEFGRLALVVPPRMADMLSFTTVPKKYLTDEFTRAYCYYYVYDGRGNMIRKHIPGRNNDETMEYDSRNRMIKYCNGNYELKTQAEGVAPNYENYWQLHKYDDLNRLVQTKLARVEMNGSQVISSDTVLMASYIYDNRTAAVFAPQPGILSNHDYNPLVKGQKIWERFLILSPDMMQNPKYVEQSYCYDKMYRVIQVSRQGPGYPRTHISTRYSYAGMPLIRRESCPEMISGSLSVNKHKLDSYYTYDDRGRIRSELTVLNQNDSTRIDYTYDALGKLIEKTQDGVSESYDYNIQGWLTSQKNPYFSSDLYYYNPQFSIPRYSGNITQWSWKHRDDDSLNTYVLRYTSDRLRAAYHHVGQSAGSFSENSLTYDKEGNILTLQRTSDGVTENLNYDYDFSNGGLQHVFINKTTANLLQDNHEVRSLRAAEQIFNSRSLPNTGIVNDWTAKVLPDINSSLLTGDTYRYDVNLNVIYDPIKKLNIRYNCLNLPEKILRDSANFVNYTYLADGTKWSVEDNSGNGFNYQGSFIYKKTNGVNNLACIAFTNGKFNLDQTNVENNYYCTDHLGSVRVVYNSQGDIKERNDYYPLGSRWELPDSPTSDNVFRFNGKEQQVIGDVNYLDYGARMYDSYTGRWLAQDPLAALYHSTSPYAYCANNPANAVDLQGKLIIFINGNTFSSKEKGTANYWQNSDNPNGRFGDFSVAVQDRLNDHNVMYRHGGTSLSALSRRADGTLRAREDFEEIINRVSQDGEINETIKIITHSMGGAWGNGYARELKRLLKENGLAKKIIISLIADFDPYQAASYGAVPDVKTMQFTHSVPSGFLWWLANQTQKDLDKDNYYKDGRQGSHSVMSFFSDINRLEEGEYVWNGRYWVLNNKK